MRKKFEVVMTARYISDRQDPFYSGISGLMRSITLIEDLSFDNPLLFNFN
jgi:hypothetical protein